MDEPTYYVTTITTTATCNTTHTTAPHFYKYWRKPWRIDYRLDVFKWVICWLFGTWKEIVKSDAVIYYKEALGFRMYKEVRVMCLNNTLLIKVFYGKSRTARLLRRRV